MKTQLLAFGSTKHLSDLFFSKDPPQGGFF